MENEKQQTSADDLNQALASILNLPIWEVRKIREKSKSIDNLKQEKNGK